MQFFYVNMLEVILSLLYLFGILFPPWSEESGGLVRAHAEDELTVRIPAQVLDLIKVTRYHNPRPPMSLSDSIATVSLQLSTSDFPFKFPLYIHITSMTSLIGNYIRVGDYNLGVAV